MREYDTPLKKKRVLLASLTVVLVGMVGYEIYLRGYNVPNRVAGQYGKYCYEENNVPGNVKYAWTFDTKEECEGFIERNTQAREAEAAKRDAIRAENTRKRIEQAQQNEQQQQTKEQTRETPNSGQTIPLQSNTGNTILSE